LTITPSGGNLKPTFFHLEESKRDRILAAAVAEFARNGYDRAVLDAIVRKAGISKGGLYEYIESKEDLFAYALERSYARMRDFIVEREAESFPPADPVARSRSIAGIAVDFYVSHPETIEFLVSSAGTEHPAMRRLAGLTFSSYFEDLFESCDFSVYRFGRERVLDLLGWILVKTRNDFIGAFRESGDAEACRLAYLAEWDFFLSSVTYGIYRPGRSPDET